MVQSKVIRYAMLAIMVAAIFILLLRPFDDPDTFWHIETGKYILNSGHIPSHDPFGWYSLKNNLKWIPHEWLFDVIIYTVSRITGLIGVSAFCALMGASIYYLLYKIINTRTGNFILSLGTAFGCMVLVNPFIVPRPQIMSYLLLLVLINMLDRHRWWAIIPIILFGVNVHGGFYPVYILVFLIYAFRKCSYKYFIAAGISVLANPFLTEILLYPIRIQQHSKFMFSITEWLAPALNLKINPEVVVVFFICIFINKSRWVGNRDILLNCILLVYSISSVRHTVFLSLLIVPLASNGINELYKISKHWVISKYANFPIDTLRKILPGCIAASIIFFTVLNAAQAKPLGIDSSKYPVKAVQFIKDSAITDIFNIYSEGGYMIFKGVHPLIDGRADIFIPYYNKDCTLFDDYVDTLSMRKDYNEFFAKYGIKNIVVTRSSEIAISLGHDPRYKIIYSDDTHVIYTKVKGD